MLEDPASSLCPCDISSEEVDLRRVDHGAGIASTGRRNMEAETIIANNLDNLHNGTIDVEIPAGVGRVVNPNNTFSPATHARLVPSGSGVKTAFPIILD